jgi:endoglucanase
MRSADLHRRRHSRIHAYFDVVPWFTSMPHSASINRLAVIVLSGAFCGATLDSRIDPHILVDQFGYRPGDPKVAVIRNPNVGFDASEKFTPGPRYEVRRANDGAVVFSGVPTAWNGGAVEASSGDNGWWFDFSPLSTPGKYFVNDAERNRRSPSFVIDQQVYKPILKAAVRTYFYQRSGFTKRTPSAQSCWNDGAAYLGADQDSQAHDVTDPRNTAKVRDLSGGWFDAGDTNKYVTNAVQPVHQLLTAYQNNPAVFTDDFDIPESGNGVPDVVDEVKWEIEWLKKMQYPDGSVALKVGALNYVAASPPSSDRSPRFYVPSCTSATISAAGMYAHAAYVLRTIPALADAAADLDARAVRAWSNYQSEPERQIHCDSGAVRAGVADWSAADQDAEAVVAAIYLYANTGAPAYEDYLKANYRRLHSYHDIGWSRYHVEQGEALLFYTTLPRADATLKGRIIADKLADVVAGHQIYGFDPNDDLYRSFLHDAQYHWGSNAVRAAYGNSNLDVINYRIEVPDTSGYRTRASGVLHYMHGVNPFAKVYLTNMKSYGAYSSVNEIFHAWFWPGTKWSNALHDSCGPAPGYVPGGPVANAVAAGVPRSVIPPADQPAQKSYRDWNGTVRDAEKSYVINEAGIYYQSAYVELLAAFAQ